MDAETIADLSAEELLEAVTEATETLDDDTVAETLRFLNIHYLAAGATIMGSLAQGGYEYDGLEYSGQWPHSTTSTNMARDYESCASPVTGAATR